MDRFKRGMPTKIKLTERDLKIFRLLSVHRVLNSRHIAQFLGVPENTFYRKRLKDLFDNRYLDRVRNYQNAFSEQGSDKIIYALSDTGAQELVSTGEKVATRGRTKNNERLKVHRLNHDLKTMDFLGSVLALGSDQTTLFLADEILATASESQRLKKQPLSMNVEFDYLGTYTHKALIPDALFAIEPGNRRKHYFLEIDTGSENQTRSTPKLESILRKMKGYSNIYKDKIAKQSFNIDNFKVLFVTTTDKRIDYMIEKVFNEYIAGDIPRNIFLFSTFEKTKSNLATGKVWKNCRGEAVSFFD
jgi:hypothetical protein